VGAVRFPCGVVNPFEISVRTPLERRGERSLQIAPLVSHLALAKGTVLLAANEFRKISQSLLNEPISEANLLSKLQRNGFDHPLRVGGTDHFAAGSLSRVERQTGLVIENSADKIGGMKTDV